MITKKKVVVRQRKNIHFDTCTDKKKKPGNIRSIRHHSVVNVKTFQLSPKTWSIRPLHSVTFISALMFTVRSDELLYQYELFFDCLTIYLTHFRTVVIAGNGTHRLVDISFFCFDTCLRRSLKFFSAARLRWKWRKVKILVKLYGFFSSANIQLLYII